MARARPPITINARGTPFGRSIEEGLLRSALTRLVQFEPFQYRSLPSAGYHPGATFAALSSMSGIWLMDLA